MTWPPLDSADVKERREAEAVRAGAEAAEPPHDSRCVDGWIGEDAEGRPIACVRCRPHLTNRRCMTCQATRTTCESRREQGLGVCCSDCAHEPRAQASPAPRAGRARRGAV